MPIPGRFLFGAELARVFEREIEVESRDLDVVAEIATALAGPSNLRTALHQALKNLSSYGVLRASVSLLRMGSTETAVEASYGVAEAGELARYRLGEGITGRVIESGKATIVRRIREEPMFLNRTGRALRDQEITFICAPIVIDGKPAGALGVDLGYRPDRDYGRDLIVLKVVAAMIGQAVKVHRLLDAERERLLEENVHLKEELRERYDFSKIIGNSGRIHVSLESAVAAYEKDLIQDALKTTRGNRSAAGRLLETTERIINYKIRKYEIDPDRFRTRMSDSSTEVTPRQ
jgi:transcriptional regulator with GAF, ATPase, and Fis domain